MTEEIPNPTALLQQMLENDWHFQVLYFSLRVGGSKREGSPAAATDGSPSANDTPGLSTVRAVLGIVFLSLLTACESTPPSLRLSGGVVQAVDAESGQVVDTIDVGIPVERLEMASGPDGTTLGVAGNRRDSLVRLLDPRRRTAVNTVYLKTTGAVFTASPDTSRLYVADLEASVVRVRSLPDGVLVQTVPTGIEPVTLDVSPDGQGLAVGAETSRTVTFHRTASEETAATHAVPGQPVEVEFISPTELRVQTTTVDTVLVVP